MLKFPALFAGLALAPLIAFGQTGTEAQAATAREAALVEFYGASALGAAERTQLDAAVRQTFNRSPAEARSASQDAAEVLAILKKQQSSNSNLAFARALGRRQMAFSNMHALGPGQEGKVAAELVAAHDPVVVSDPEQKLVLTMSQVRALADAIHDQGALFGVSLPGNETELVTAVKRDWPTTDVGLRQALANAEQDLPHAAGFLQAASPAKRQAFVAQYRPKIMAGADVAEREYRLAEVMAFTGQAGFRNRSSSGGAASAIRKAREMQNAADSAGRAMLPGCGPAAGKTLSPETSSFCHP